MTNDSRKDADDFSDPMTGRHEKSSRHVAAWKATKPMQGEEGDLEDEDEEDEDEENEDEDEDEENDEADEDDEDEVEDGDDPDAAKLFDEVILLASNLTYSHFRFVSGRCHRKCP